MTGQDGVAYSRRGLALTTWGTAAMVAAIGLLVLDRPGSAALLRSSRIVAMALLVACAVDCAFALVGFRARVRGVAAPARATAGGEVTTRVLLDGNRDLLATIPAYPGLRPVRTDPDGAATIVARMGGHWVNDEFSLQVLRIGPLGLGMCTQRAVVPLREPLVVLPCPDAAAIPLPHDANADVATGGWAPRGHGQGPVDQLREHQPGDGFRSIHWAATARRGELVVAVREQPARGATHVVIDLGDRVDQGEAVIARAQTVIRGLLARGDEVTISSWCTPGLRLHPPRWPYLRPRTSLGEPQARTVTARSMREAEIALGRAVVGPPPDHSGPAYLMSPASDRWVDGHHG